MVRRFEQIFKPELKPFLVCFLTFCVVLPLLLHRNKFSPYYIGERTTKSQRIINYRVDNAEKNHAAEASLKFLKTDINQLFQQKHHPANSNHPSSSGLRSINVAISIITVDRVTRFNGKYYPGYLTQVMSQFVKIVNSTAIPTHFNLTFSLCNVDQHPYLHQEAVNMSKYIPMVRKPIQGKYPRLYIKEQEKQDYVFCLEKSMKTSPDYVLLVEDDTVPSLSLFESIDHLLRVRLVGKSDIAYIKLYHPQRLIGYWNPELSRWFELVGIGSILGTVAYIVCTQFLKRCSGLHWYLMFCLYFCSVVFVIGRGNLLWLRTYNNFLRVLGPSPTCCSPAFLFPVESASAIAKHLKSVTCVKRYAKDAAIDEYVGTSKHQALYYEPNLFEHIGVYSSLHGSLVDPIMVA